MPKRVKRRKQFRGTMTGKAMRGNKITYGEYGIVALEPAWIKSNQIEAARIAMILSSQKERRTDNEYSRQNTIFTKTKRIFAGGTC